jgi:hypothetical protein
LAPWWRCQSIKPPFQPVLWLLTAQGVLGAFDTIYFHELRARLPALQTRAKSELVLHSLRSLIYGLFFLTLPWLVWRGAWTIVLVFFLALEIFITMYDFVIEDWVRKPLGGVYPAERVLHGVLGVLYGIFLSYLFPILREWWRGPTGFAGHAVAAPALQWTMAVMGILAVLSGLRDLAAAYALPYSGWPWMGTLQERP